METAQVSIDRWIDKEVVVYICNGILTSHKKEWIFAICDYMDGPRGHSAKWNKSERERKLLHVFTYI